MENTGTYRNFAFCVLAFYRQAVTRERVNYLQNAFFSKIRRDGLNISAINKIASMGTSKGHQIL